MAKKRRGRARKVTPTVDDHQNGSQDMQAAANHLLPDGLLLDTDQKLRGAVEVLREENQKQARELEVLRNKLSKYKKQHRKRKRKPQVPLRYEEIPPLAIEFAGQVFQNPRERLDAINEAATSGIQNLVNAFVEHYRSFDEIMDELDKKLEELEVILVQIKAQS